MYHHRQLQPQGDQESGLEANGEEKVMEEAGGEKVEAVESGGEQIRFRQQLLLQMVNRYTYCIGIFCSQIICTKYLF